MDLYMKFLNLLNFLVKSVQNFSRHSTHFYQQDEFETIVKKIHFYNSLVPNFNNMRQEIQTIFHP